MVVSMNFLPSECFCLQGAKKNKDRDGSILIFGP